MISNTGRTGDKRGQLCRGVSPSRPPAPPSGQRQAGLRPFAPARTGRSEQGLTFLMSLLTGRGCAHHIPGISLGFGDLLEDIGHHTVQPFPHGARASFAPAPQMYGVALKWH